MDFLAMAAESFIGLFELGGEVFLGLVTGILPTLIVLITAVKALIKFIGEERIDNVAGICGKNVILRYSVLPVISMFVLCNPMAYTMGRFLEEKHKPAYYDSAVSFCHPILGLFPHANAGEYFVYGGIAAGITAQSLSLGPLAVRYFIAGLIVIFIRGIVTELITAKFMNKGGEANV
jgi:PTS system glucitol/sorbitol-specific IIC component